MNPKISTLLFLIVLVAASADPQHEAGGSRYGQLIQQQTQFENQLNLIEADLASAMIKLKTASTPSEKVGILESEIAKQRQLIFSSTKTLLPAVNLTKCTCDRLSPDQKQAVINELAAVRSSILNLQRDLNSAPVCNRTRQMYLDLNAQLYFIDNIISILKSKCAQRAILSPTIWQTNLNAANWILGDQTLDDVIQEYYQRAITYDNITNCDIRKPFFSEGRCISCPTKQPIFNLYTGKCINCKSGQVFDSGKRACVQGDLVEQECPKGTYLDGKTGACIRLINCNANQFFNGSSKTCQNYVECGEEQWLNRKTNKCERFKECADQWLDKINNECVDFKSCPPGFHVNKVTNWCDKIIVCNNQFFNRETLQCVPYEKCDPETTFLDRSINQCVPYKTCPEGLILNKLINQCTSAPQCDPEKEIYSPLVNKCVPLKQCPPGEVLNKEYNRCEPCTNGAIDQATGQCIPCKNGEKYDPVSKQCAKQCGPDVILNVDAKQCVEKPKIYRFNEQAATNVIQGKVSLDQYQNQIERVIRSNKLVSAAECPADKPYSLLTSCTACPGSFVLDSQECGSCPQGSTYDQTTKSCKLALFLSNPQGKLDLGGLTFAEFESWRNSIIHRNPNANAQTCPAETPYSNGGSKCVACQGENEVWDIITNSCKPCEKFNAADRRCE